MPRRRSNPRIAAGPTAASAAHVPTPKDFSPQLAVLAEHPPVGDQWLHEIKFDGYRLVAHLNAGDVKLFTRNGNDWTSKFQVIADSLRRLDVSSAIIDGEAVVLDSEGRSDFQALQGMIKDKEKAVPQLFAFDLPFFNGEDLSERPLLERKEMLKNLLSKGGTAPVVEYSSHVVGNSERFLAEACKLSLEGIISKRIDATYVSRRDPTWVKSKCQQRQEFVVIGFTDPQGSRAGFGSLLLGYHDAQKRLVYAGRVGTGFDDKLLVRLHSQLSSLQQKDYPTHLPPPSRERRGAHWVEPTLVAEVRFTGWTRDGLLRHPAFIALRTDKPASQVVRERPIEVSPEGTTAVDKKKTTKRAASAKAIAKPSDAAEAIVAGVRLTHPGKVLYPEQGETKSDVAGYYEIASRWMLPHIVGRPLALVRCPAGQSSKCFFQRNWSDNFADAVTSIDVSEPKKATELHVAINDLAGLISLVQISVLEIHGWNCRGIDVQHPDQLVFDLDPGPDLAWKRVVEATKILRRTLTDVGLPTFLKTSGGKGLHIVVPVEPTVDWDTSKKFCETIAKSLAESNPLFVANMRKDLRQGKVYIDYHRNGRGAMAVAPYSTRAREGAPVSMPITWDDLSSLRSAAQFTVRNAAAHLKLRKTNPWADFEKERIDLLRLVRR